MKTSVDLYRGLPAPIIVNILQGVTWNFFKCNQLRTDFVMTQNSTSQINENDDFYMIL